MNAVRTVSDTIGSDWLTPLAWDVVILALAVIFLAIIIVLIGFALKMRYEAWLKSIYEK
ncbi:MAG: hypothetical protein JSV43_04605 [Methanobacteriota archaeon]|nr:MAG: hypothetical protein JSV43_04605 [Euryarchaeota archaeon]